MAVIIVTTTATKAKVARIAVMIVVAVAITGRGLVACFIDHKVVTIATTIIGNSAIN